MNKTKQKISAVIVTVLLGVGGIWFYGANQNTTNEPVQQQTQVVKQASEITISEDQKTVSYEGQTGKTALEVLKSSTEVTTEESSFGEFVTGINGKNADASKEYWSFYVDGGYASEGAGTYETTDGEKIEWKLESL